MLRTSGPENSTRSPPQARLLLSKTLGTGRDPRNPGLGLSLYEALRLTGWGEGDRLRLSLQAMVDDDHLQGLVG